MDYTKLFESLAQTAEQLKQMRIEEIDFEQLATELETVGAILQSLQARAAIADKLAATVQRRTLPQGARGGETHRRLPANWWNG